MRESGAEAEREAGYSHSAVGVSRSTGVHHESSSAREGEVVDESAVPRGTLAPMSVDLTVYMPRAAMPTPSVWAETIVELGFPAELDDEFDVDEFSGYLSCRFEDDDVGFEYSSGPVEFVDDLELPEEFDFQVTLSTHADLRELAAAVVCAAALCTVAGGVLVDPEGDVTVTAENAVAWARQQLDAIG